jgi:hypothetical protein
MATMNKSMTQPFNGGSGIADKAQQTASNVANVAREQVTTRVTEKVNDQKTRAAASIGGIASALRDGSLDQNELLSDYVSRAADGLESATSYFRDKDLGEIVDDVERFARREPALFIGGAFALGLLAARFLKSSSRRQQLAFDDDELYDTLPREPVAALPRMTPRPLAPPRVDPLPQQSLGVKTDGNNGSNNGGTL